MDVPRTPRRSLLRPRPTAHLNELGVEPAIQAFSSQIPVAATIQAVTVPFTERPAPARIQVTGAENAPSRGISGEGLGDSLVDPPFLDAPETPALQPAAWSLLPAPPRLTLVPSLAPRSMPREPSAIPEAAEPSEILEAFEAEEEELSPDWGQPNGEISLIQSRHVAVPVLDAGTMDEGVDDFSAYFAEPAPPRESRKRAQPVPRPLITPLTAWVAAFSMIFFLGGVSTLALAAVLWTKIGSQPALPPESAVVVDREDTPAPPAPEAPPAPIPAAEPLPTPQAEPEPTPPPTTPGKRIKAAPVAAPSAPVPAPVPVDDNPWNQPGNTPSAIPQAIEPPGTEVDKKKKKDPKK